MTAPSNHRQSDVTPVMVAKVMLDEAVAERDRAIGALRQYADHQSWRCAHPDRYPWGEPYNDCPCGLISTLKTLGIEVAND